MNASSPLSEKNSSALSRRRFLAVAASATAAATTALPNSVSAQKSDATASNPPPSPAADAGQPVKLPQQYNTGTERASGPPPTPLPPPERVGFAIVGLGQLAVEQLIPAFAQCEKAKLVALVSGSLEKAATIARQHGIAAKNVYDYKNYDSLRDNPEVQAIYIVLPNSMHAEFTIRGAKAGKHILCEKPMATSVADCEAMIAACKAADRKLMIAYRIQYEPHNRQVQKFVREKTFGAIKLIEAVNGQNQGDPGQWRHKHALAGGGALPDVGIYCLNTTRFLLGEEPTEVSAQMFTTSGDPRFKEVEETMTFQLRFPSGVLANLATGYGHHETRRYRVLAERGWFGMDPAFSYKGLRAEAAHAEGKIEHREMLSMEEKNQFALEIDHFAECVKKNQTPFTPGEEGLQDQRIMEALYRAAKEGRTVKLDGAATGGGKLDAFRGTPPTQG